MDHNIPAKDHVQRLRITTHGKIKCWVALSLRFLLNVSSLKISVDLNNCFQQEDPDCKRVILDTLPNPVDISIPATDTNLKNDIPDRLHPSTNMVYRLISVVEIIKREYLKLLETTHSTRLLGLHQYNEIGTLEDLGIAVKFSNETAAADEHLNELESTEVKRLRNIIQAISGKQLLVLSSCLYVIYGFLTCTLDFFLVHDEKKHPSCVSHFRPVSYLSS